LAEWDPLFCFAYCSISKRHTHGWNRKQGNLCEIIRRLWGGEERMWIVSLREVVDENFMLEQEMDQEIITLLYIVG
jgi:hypothetical protein